MMVVIYLAIGLVIGSISGVLGIGGGVLLVPALMWICGFTPGKAAGTSLAILIPPIGLPAAWRAYNARQVDVEAALWIAAAFTLGAYVSRGLADYIPEFTFRLVFGLLMIYIAVRFMLASSSEAASAAAGLAAAFVAWLVFVGLTLLGRRHLRPPELGKEIQARAQQKHEEIDYHI
jgi:uncharacterized membrane protein YfcA